MEGQGGAPLLSLVEGQGGAPLLSLVEGQGGAPLLSCGYLPWGGGLELR